MKCVICPPSSCYVSDEAAGTIIRVDAHVINGTQQLGTLNAEVIVPFGSSTVQMTNAVKTKVRDEFLRLFGISVTANDTVWFGGGIS